MTNEQFEGLKPGDQVRLPPSGRILEVSKVPESVSYYGQPAGVRVTFTDGRWIETRSTSTVAALEGTTV